MFKFLGIFMGLWLFLVSCSGGNDENKNGKDSVLFEMAEVTDTHEAEVGVAEVDFEEAIPEEDAEDTKFSKYKVGYTEPSFEEKNGFLILRLIGTPYEMGYQHGTFLKDKIKEGLNYVKSTIMGVAFKIAKSKGLVEEAYKYTYPDIIEECQGLSDAVGDEELMDICVTLSYGDVVFEYIESGGFGCSQFVVTGDATVNGEMIHGRNLDWTKLDFIMENPTIIVRAPTSGIPYVVLGFPMNVVPYQIINMAKLSAAIDEANTESDHKLGGRAHSQMMLEAMKKCENLDEVEEFFKSQPHSSAEIVVFSDFKNNDARVFEMTATHFGVRKIKNGVIYATNHFVSDEMKKYDVPHDKHDSSIVRFLRLSQLLEPDGDDTVYGTIDPVVAIDKILKDNIDPYTKEPVPFDEYDNDKSIATNGTMQSFIYLPATNTIYIAKGQVPLLKNPFYGFSIDELFMKKDFVTPQPESIE